LLNIYLFNYFKFFGSSNSYNSRGPLGHVAHGGEDISAKRYL